MDSRSAKVKPGPSAEDQELAQLDKLRAAGVANAFGASAGRRTPRRPFQRSVGVLVGGHYEVLRGRQLSEGGMSLFLGEIGSQLPLQVEEVGVGKNICVTFVLPSGESLSLRGEVIYHDTESSQGLILGVKYVSVSLHQKRLIRAYVSSKKVGEMVQA